MRHTAFSGVVRTCPKGTSRSLASLLFAFCALAFLFTGPLTHAQKKTAALPAPSEGKAIVCIYREGRFTGSASHDELYVNGIHLGKLLNGEYMFTEVLPGTVVISGLPKMYYRRRRHAAGSAINAATRKENERIRFEADGRQHLLPEMDLGRHGHRHQSHRSSIPRPAPRR